jgi:Ulp1 family protease
MGLFDLSQWKLKILPVASQRDGFSCGIFVILNMFRMMKNVFESHLLEVNHNKVYSPEEKTNIRQCLIEICCMRQELQVLDSYVA